MASKTSSINGGNIYEWLCSLGYLLPANEVELTRFEILHPAGSIQVNEAAIDPMAIINDTKQRKVLSFSIADAITSEQEELRMAARKHTNFPDEILEKIKRNQQQQKGDKPDEQ